MIHPTAVIGDPPEHRDHRDERGIAPYIDPTARLEAFVTVDAGVKHPTFVGERAWLMKRVHVGHDAHIGNDCEVAPGCTIGGHVLIEDGCRLGMSVTIKPFITIGAGARIGCGAVVIRDVPPGQVWAGNPARMIHETQDLHTPLEADGWEHLAGAVGVEHALGQEA